MVGWVLYCMILYTLSQMTFCFPISSEKSQPSGVLASPNWPSSTLTQCAWKLDRSSDRSYLVSVMDIANNEYHLDCGSDAVQNIEFLGM